jgi:hypothetical protein
MDDMVDEEAVLERPSTFPPHHVFNLAVSSQVKALMVRDKRQIFVSMRSGPVTANSFFPKFGVCASEFSTWQILNENPRRTLARSLKNTMNPVPDLYPLSK